MNDFDQATISMAFPPHHAFIFPPHDVYEEDHNINTNHLPFPPCPPQLFHGGGAVLPFMMKRSVSFSGVDHHHKYNREEVVVQMEDESSDDGLHVGEKKKRLNSEQVKALEKSFELGNKLQPDTKLQLAKALGLKPRQVAIWFQNRRARWKTKQLEKDYDVLKKQFEALKADTHALQSQNNKLNAELLSLKTKDSTKSEVNYEGSRSSKSLFSASSMRPTSTVQILQGPSRPDLPCNKLDQQDMFNGVDHEQQGFWTWGDHQNFH